MDDHELRLRCGQRARARRSIGLGPTGHGEMADVPAGGSPQPGRRRASSMPRAAGAASRVGRAALGGLADLHEQRPRAGQHRALHGDGGGQPEARPRSVPLARIAGISDDSRPGGRDQASELTVSASATAASGAGGLHLDPDPAALGGHRASDRAPSRAGRRARRAARRDPTNPPAHPPRRPRRRWSASNRPGAAAAARAAARASAGSAASSSIDAWAEAPATRPHPAHPASRRRIRGHARSRDQGRDPHLHPDAVLIANLRIAAQATPGSARRAADSGSRADLLGPRPGPGGVPGGPQRPAHDDASGRRSQADGERGEHRHQLHRGLARAPAASTLRHADMSRR